MDWLARLSQRVDQACRLGAAGFLALMVALIAIQVVARYVFSEPPGWTEEGARYAMVWSGLLGATVAFKAGGDPVLLDDGASGDLQGGQRGQTQGRKIVVGGDRMV